MDALVMCGGPGTRLDRGEKPLFEVGGVAMVERVRRALEGSRIETALAVTSPHTPETTHQLEARITVIETAGDGYVDDLGTVLERVDRPVLTVASDLPLLTSGIVDRTIERYEHVDGEGALTVCVPTVLKRRLGVSTETTHAHGGRELSPTGLNVVGVGTDETIHVSHDARLAVNVNRPGDATVAEAFAATVDGGLTDGS